MPIVGDNLDPITAVITLDDAARQLRMRNTPSGADGDQLQMFCDAATTVVEFYRGDVITRSYAEVYSGGDISIYTRHTPIRSVESLVEYAGTLTYTLTNQPEGHAVDSWGYTIDDPDTGRIVRRGASGTAVPFPAGNGNVAISYTTGMTTVPAEAKLAALIIVQHLWKTQRGSAPAPASGDDGDQQVPGVFYAIPNAAIDLLRTDGRDPVFA